MATKYLAAAANNSAASWWGSRPYLLNFVGASSRYVNVPTSSALNFGTGAFSVSFWVNATNPTASQDSMVAKDSYAGGSSYAGWMINIGSSNKLNFETRAVVSGSGPDNAVLSTAAFPTATLTHVCCVRDGSSPATLRIYINGSLNNSASEASSTNVSASTAMTIGAINASSLSQYFDGSISNIIIYNTNLTSGNVSSLYNSGAGVYSDPIGGAVYHARFDEGSGTTLSDAVNSNTGNLINSPTWSAKAVCLNVVAAPGIADVAHLNGNNLTLDVPLSCSSVQMTGGEQLIVPSKTLYPMLARNFGGHFAKA